MRIGAFIAIGLTLLLISCAAVGPRFTVVEEAPVGKALVYFYRPDQRANHGRTVSIMINRLEYARLTNGGYTKVRLDPGRYEFAQRLENVWIYLPSHTFQMQVN